MSGKLVAQPGRNEEPPCRDRSTDTELDTEARLASVQDSGDGVVRDPAAVACDLLASNRQEVEWWQAVS